MGMVDWQFCSAIQLAPRDMSAYVDMLDAIRRPSVPPDVLRSALSQLRTAEPDLRSYAIPPLVARLRTEADPEIQGLLAATLVMAAGDRVSEQRLARLSTTSTSHLADLVREAEPSRFEPAASDHIGVGRQAAAVLALSLLRELARAEFAGDENADEDRVPFSESLLTGVAPLRMVQEARSGSLGRVPLVLAFESLTLVDDASALLADELVASTGGTWAGQPDVVAVLQALEARAAGCRTPAAVAAWALVEATGLGTYSRRVHGLNPDRIRRGLTWLRPAGAEAPALALVLWQASAWALAAEADADAATESLTVYWGAPSGLKAVHMDLRSHKGRPEVCEPFEHLMQWRLPAHGQESQKIVWHEPRGPRDPFPPALTALFSPWMDRNIADYSPSTQVRQGFATFRGLHDAVATVRLLANLPTVLSLAAAREQPPTFILDLVLNALDVFRDPHWRDHLTSIPRKRDQAPSLMGLSAPIVGIAVQQHTALERFVKGSEFSPIPRLLTDHVRSRLTLARAGEGEARQFIPRQLLLLHEQASPIQLAHAAFESLSGEAWDAPGAARSPWFSGGTASPAADLLRHILDEVWDRIPRRADPSDVILEPALVAQDKYPDLLKASGRTWDWLATYRSRRGRVPGRKILLSQPLTAPEWQDIGRLDTARLDHAALPIALTDRLDALLAAGVVDGSSPDFTRWRDRVEGINTERHFDRAFRRRLARLLEADPGGTTGVDIQRIALAAIMEFSGGTIRYQAQAGRAVSGGSDTPGRRDLQADWLHAMRTGTRAAPAGLRGPWDVVLNDVADHERVQLVEQFVAQRPASAAPLLLETLDAVDERRRPSTLTLEARGPGGDEVLLFSQRRDGVVSKVTHPVTEGSDGVVNPFREERRQARTLGLVAGGTEGHLAVNVGAGAPIDAGGRTQDVGALVIVEPDGNARPLPPLPPQDGEIRHAEVSVVDGVLTVAPADAPAWRPGRDVEEETGRLWLADPSSLVGRSVRAECRVVHRARRSAWEPVPEDFARFILEVLPGEDAGSATLVVVDPVTALPTHGPLLVSTGLGHLYALRPDVWSDDAAVQLAREVGRLTSGGGSAQGLLVSVRLTQDERGLPRLTLSDAPCRDGLQAPFDDRNRRWEEAFRPGVGLAARHSGAGWVADVDVPGFPPTVAVELDLGSERWPSGEEDAIQVRTTAEGWSAARRARAQARCKYIPEVRLQIAPAARTPEALAAFLGARGGVTLELAELTGRSDGGAWEGYTVEGWPVWVEKDSLSLAGTEPRPGLVRGRTMVVQHWWEATGAPRKAQPVAIPGLPAEKASLRGLVTRFAPSDGDCEVWMDGSGGLRLIVPLSAFTVPPAAVGDVVVADGRGEGRWIFDASPRRVLARALWRTRKATQAPEGALLLDDALVPELGRCRVLQDLNAPVLHCLTRWKPGVTPSCGVLGADRAVVRFLRRRHDELGRGVDVVVLGSHGGEWVGEAPRGQFSVTGEPWSTAILRLEQGPRDLPGCVYAHREFTKASYARRSVRPPEPARTPPAVASRPDPSQSVGDAGPDRLQEPAWLVQFRAWVEAGDPAVIGQVDPDDPRFLVLDAPVAGADGRPVTVVRFADREPWVRGRHYDNGYVRAALRQEHSGDWVASVRRVDPVALADFAQRVAPQGKPLFCAGRTRTGAFRFEWGLGWTLELTADEVETGNRSFWFGDQIARYRVRWTKKARGESRPILQVQDVLWQVEARIREDAKLRIVHQLRAQVRRRGATHVVDVRTVETRTRGIQTAGRLASAGTRERVYNAVLSPSSQEALLTRLREQGVDLDQAPSVAFWARLDAEADPEVTGKQVFDIVTTDPHAPGMTSLQEGESLILEAGSITLKAPSRITGISNDMEITFTGRHDGDLEGDLPLRVTVMRRDFSLRESSLRLAHERDADEYAGTPMWVRLTSHRGNGHWLGSVVEAPTRPEHTFAHWSQAVGSDALVVVGHRKGGRTPIEVLPGVIGQVKVDGRHAAGSLCRLVKGERGLRLVEVLPGEETYVPEGGRGAALLLTDEALRNRGQVAANHAHFTVAGLPSLWVTDAKAAAAMVHRYPPRTGLVVKEGGRLVLGAGEGNVGKLSREGTIQTIPRSRQESVPAGRGWPDLSFLDDTPEALARHTRQGRWYYHDRETGLWKGRDFIRVPLPNPVRSEDGPLFFTEDWRLRFPAQELKGRAFPMTEVLERGLPQPSNYWYPVAGSHRNGLWVEMSPGRIVDVRAALLQAPGNAGTTDLSELRWGDFAAGDRVRLSRRSAQGGPLASLRLEGWRPGPRGHFGTRRALLPVATDDQGGLLLGQGHFTLRYPAQTGVEQDVVWLQQDNRLAPFDGHVEVGDVLLLARDVAGSLHAVGAPDVPIRLAEDWEAHGWLGEWLTSDAEAALGVLGGAIPVAVVALDGGTAVVRPAARESQGSIMMGRVLGLQDADHVVVWAGASLHRLPIAAVLPGCPASAVPELVARLGQGDLHLWLRRTDAGWTSAGRSSAQHATRPLLATSDGLLCQNQEDLTLEWLPMAELGWPGGASPAEVVKALRALGPAVTVAPYGTSTVSILRTKEGRRVREQVAASLSQRVTILCALGGDEGPLHSYLGALLPSTVLVLLEAESEQVVGDVPVAADVRPRPGGGYSAVAEGHRRTELDLSPWLVDALRRAYNRSIVPAQLAEIVAERGAGYRRVKDGVAPDAEAPVGERLLHECQSLLSGEPVDWTPLARWLESEGLPLVAGVTDGRVTVGGSWDVAPYLAAVLMLDAAGAAGVGRASELAVHATARLAALAATAIHEEVLLTEWLLSPVALTRHGRWQRLANLRLGGTAQDGHPDARFDGTLSEDQLSQVWNCCWGILTMRNAGDRSLRATALALSHAIGQGGRPGELYEVTAHCHLRTLNTVGRTLTPGVGTAAAQPSLSPLQIDRVRVTLQKLLADGLPLAFIPKNADEPDPARREWAESLCRTVVANVARGEVSPAG